MSEVNAPTFAIQIEGEDLDVGVTQLIETVEYESVDGMADMARIRAVNPDFLISDAKVFQPGNEMSIWLGYGSQLQHVGRVVIVKQTPNFPQDGMPTIQVTGYTADYKMMDNAPEESKKRRGKGGRAFVDAKHSDAVEDRFADYDFQASIQPTPDQPHNFFQKVGLTDYDFVRGLANLNGFLFWVEGDADGAWSAYFWDPENLLEPLQELEYTFQYNQGNESALFSFQPELLIRGATTKLRAITKDPKTGRRLEIEVEEENNAAPDTSAASDVTGEVKGESTTASDVKLFLGEFSIDVVANRKFKNAAELTAWAQQWFRRQRENFVLSRGRTIGLETLMARQTHNIQGVGTLYSGQYYFTKVKHLMSRDQGYVCDFAARKVVP